MTTRTRIGVGGTVVWVAVAVGFLIWKRSLLGDMSLNEWGDYFAGFISPIAFLWFILGYYQQSDELQQNTTALKLQALELQHQVAETRALVKEAERQATVSADLLNLERQQIAETRRKEKARLQPTFHFASGSASGNMVDMRFRNEGGSATGLAIISSPPGVTLSMQPADYLASGAEGRIIAQNLANYPVIVTITYRDADGDSGEYQIELHTRGSFRPVVPAKPSREP